VPAITLANALEAGARTLAQPILNMIAMAMAFLTTFARIGMELRVF
jgi:hypothetical protein